MDKTRQLRRLKRQKGFEEEEEKEEGGEEEEEEEEEYIDSISLKLYTNRSPQYIANILKIPNILCERYVFSTSRFTNPESDMYSIHFVFNALFALLVLKHKTNSSFQPIFSEPFLA